MAKPNKNTVTIPVLLPPGITIDPTAVTRAQVAAQAIIDQAASQAALQALLTSIERKGFNVTPAQWAVLQGDSSARPYRPRVLLSDEQRKEVVKRVKEGATGVVLCREFGISLATVNNIKKAEGLSKQRAPKAKAAKKGRAKRA